MLKAVGRAKSARHAATGRAVSPEPPSGWFADAVDDYTLEKQTRRKPRARSMDVALGLKRPPGRPKGTQRVAREPQSIFTTFGSGANLGMGSPIAIRWTFAASADL